MWRFAALSALLGVFLAAAPAGAEQPTTGEIIDALKPKPPTRSWGRGIKVEGGQQPAQPPSIDLHVSFAFDSDELDTDARFILDNLGRALVDPQLRDYRFLLAGHTDAKGTDEYNEGLSGRRAASVERYLIERYGISPSRLTTVGYGESRLLDPTRPEDGINRRVQIVNVGEATN